MQLARAIALIYDSDTGALVATKYDNRRPGPDTTLDRLVIARRLRGIDAVRMIAPPRKRAQRRVRRA
jgi:hypothetical protein